KRRATSWPAPISANVPYFARSTLIWNAFRFVPISISAFIQTLGLSFNLSLFHPNDLAGRFKAWKLGRSRRESAVATFELARRWSPVASPADYSEGLRKSNLRDGLRYESRCRPARSTRDSLCRPSPGARPHCP